MHDRNRNKHTDHAHRWETLARMLNEGRRIAVLTGAGISTDSGLPDFRSKGGIFDNELRVEDILSESYFHAQPKRFWEHFKSIFRFEELHQCKPNAGHLLLKELEEKGKEVVVITQNIDGLHGKAGSRRVLAWNAEHRRLPQMQGALRRGSGHELAGAAVREGRFYFETGCGAVRGARAAYGGSL